MKQKLIGLTDRQQKYLKEEAKNIGISVSELIRRILDEHIDRKDIYVKKCTNAVP